MHCNCVCHSSYSSRAACEHCNGEYYKQKVKEEQENFMSKKNDKGTRLPLNEEKITTIMAAIEAEVRRASSKHAPLNSYHEGYSVLLEEVDELWDEVKKNNSKRDLANMEVECTQIAAMAARMLYDLF